MSSTSRAAAATNRQETEQRFLDAAERLLIQVGYAGVTTRALAAEAGANPGLVHYYFGSIEEVMLRVLNRFTGRLIARQRAMYSADVPFLEKWRTAWRFQEEDLAAGYPKIWFELQALAWNRPDLRGRIVADELPVEAVTALTVTFALGYMLERLSGIREGHEPLLAWIDGWIESLERGKPDGQRKSKRPGRGVRQSKRGRR